MKNQPETKKKCVRVTYADGYQCDFPVFRRFCTEVGFSYELSSGDEWTASDPRSMNKWIDTQVSSKSPETTGSYQLRRVIRMGKFFSKTHASRLERKFPSGLVATAIFIEAYVAVNGRDDKAFRETLRNISRRTKGCPVRANGVQVSDNKDTDRISRLIDEAKACVEGLDKLSFPDTTAANAHEAWKMVFRHSFFDEADASDTSCSARLEKKSMAVAIGLASPALTSEAAAALSTTERANRLRAVAEAKKEAGGGEAPWSK